MKTLLLIGLVITVISSALVGCGSGEGSTATDSPATTTPPSGKGATQSMDATPGPGSAGGDSRVGTQGGG